LVDIGAKLRYQKAGYSEAPFRNAAMQSCAAAFHRLVEVDVELFDEKA
jgi:hypothetical protein